MYIIIRLNFYSIPPKILLIYINLDFFMKLHINCATSSFPTQPPLNYCTQNPISVRLRPKVPLRCINSTDTFHFISRASCTHRYQKGNPINHHSTETHTDFPHYSWYGAKKVFNTPLRKGHGHKATCGGALCSSSAPLSLSMSDIPVIYKR